MPKQPKESEQDKLARVERLQNAIRQLQKQIEQIRSTGEVARDGCFVSRYQVRQKEKVYWYYKLHATQPQFPKATDAKVLTKYKHLGKAGSSEHIEAVMQVSRRIMIDELQRTIGSLQDSCLDVGFDGELDPK